MTKQIWLFFFLSPLNLNAIIDDSITFWIDVCPIDGNLLASGGEDHDIKIYDRRESKIVKVFSDLHSGSYVTKIIVFYIYFTFYDF